MHQALAVVVEEVLQHLVVLVFLEVLEIQVQQEILVLQP
jgi:hypothetical protein